MRIGENGIELPVGQAYRTLDTAISDSLYTPATGQPLSGIGTIVSLEKGPADDLFFLSFDVLGTHTNVRTEPAPLIPAPPPDVARPSDIGVRTFDEINASMAAITGVSPNTASVKNTYTTVQAAAADGGEHPGVPRFAPGSDRADGDRRTAAPWSMTRPQRSYFPGLELPLSWSARRPRRSIDPLVDKVMGTDLQSQPDPTAVRAELTTLFTTKLCSGGCSDPQRIKVEGDLRCRLGQRRYDCAVGQEYFRGYEP